MAKLKDLSTLLPISGSEDDKIPTYTTSPLNSKLSRLFSQEDENFNINSVDVPVEPEFANVRPIEPSPGMITLGTPPLELDPEIKEAAMRAISNKDEARGEVNRIPASEEAKAQTSKAQENLGYYDTLKAALSAMSGAQSMSAGVTRKPDLALLDDLRDAPKRAAELEAKKLQIESEKLNQSSKKLDLENTQKMKDANSEESKAFRDQLFSLYPEYKDMPGFKNATAEQLQKNFGWLQLKEQIEARQEAAKAQAADRALRLAETLKGKSDEEKRKADQFITSATQRFVSDSNRTLEKLNDRLNEFKEIDSFVDLAVKNPTAAAGLGTKVARAMGEVGAMTENDVTRYVQNKALPAQVAQNLLSMSKGTILPETAAYLKESMAALADMYQNRANIIKRKRASQFAANTTEQLGRPTSINDALAFMGEYDAIDEEDPFMSSPLTLEAIKGKVSQKSQQKSKKEEAFTKTAEKIDEQTGKKVKQLSVKDPQTGNKRQALFDAETKKFIRYVD